jgi:hypothetical protein
VPDQSSTWPAAETLRDRDDATTSNVVAFDAGARRRTEIDHGGSPHRRAPADASRREQVRAHPMVKKAALKATLQRAVKLVDEDRIDEADLAIATYHRLRREP